MEKRGDSFVQKWHSVYFFIPVFEAPAEMPPLDRFLSAMREKFGGVEPMAEEPRMPSRSGDLLGFALLDHPGRYEKENRQVPSQLVLMGPDAFDRSLWDEQIVAQFWDCGAQRQAFAEQCRCSIMCSNMMAASLPRQEQYQLIADYARLILDLFPACIGIYWPHSQKLMPRERMRDTGWNDPALRFLDGGLNVRFFKISGTDEMLFDTLGLTAIGLPDLQCHCKGLDPDDVVLFLRNLAAYLYQRGDVIQDGSTVEGIDHGKWPCRREDAMAGPARTVLDICPGKFAGGGR